MKTVLAMTDHSNDPANFIRLLRPWSDPLFARSYRNTIGRPTETRNLDSFSSNTRVFHRQGRRIVAETKRVIERQQRRIDCSDYSLKRSNHTATTTTALFVIHMARIPLVEWQEIRRNGGRTRKELDPRVPVSDVR